jgi:hypothetical protein
VSSFSMKRTTALRVKFWNGFERVEEHAADSFRRTPTHDNTSAATEEYKPAVSGSCPTRVQSGRITSWAPLIIASDFKF